MDKMCLGFCGPTLRGSTRPLKRYEIINRSKLGPETGEGFVQDYGTVTRKERSERIEGRRREIGEEGNETGEVRVGKDSRRRQFWESQVRPRHRNGSILRHQDPPQEHYHPPQNHRTGSYFPFLLPLNLQELQNCLDLSFVGGLNSPD